MNDSLYPPELKYNSEHTWLRIEPDGTGRVGVTYFAQKQLKDVVFVELPEIGTLVTQMEPFGVIESAKATNDLYSPVSGRVKGVNTSLGADPGSVNRDPYGDGWMIAVELSAPEEVAKLITADQYASLTAGR
jgi:glycine cleavage system H protein